MDQMLVLILYEGNMLFIYFLKFFEKFGVELYVKIEGVNLMGFFKDCGMVMVVVKVKEEGNDMIMCVLMGNIFVVAVVYVVRVGMKCIVIILDGKIVFGKFVQVVMYGVEIIVIDGNFDDVLVIVRLICEKVLIVLVNLVNFYWIEG